MVGYDELQKDMELLVNSWGDAGKRVIELCWADPLKMSMNDYLNECTACGGNWGGMLLSGLKRLRPAIYEAIPDNMGSFAWACICSTLELLGIDSKEEG